MTKSTSLIGNFKLFDLINRDKFDILILIKYLTHSIKMHGMKDFLTTVDRSSYIIP